MDNEEPHDNKPLEDKSTDEIGDRPNQTQEAAPINDEKNSESEEEQFEAENNEGDISASEVNNVQIKNAGEEKNSVKAVKKSRLKLILPLYLVGLISLSIAALGFCFAPFTEYVHANYKFVPTSNFLWVWICAIIAGAIFLIDLIVVLSLKGAKRIGSLKKLFLARFSLPLAASVIACVIIGLVGGTSYYNRYKAEELARKEYGENDKTLTTPITSPSTILGQAYSQCYPPTGVTESGSYYIDSYEASITGEVGTLTGGATSAELLQTTIELGCVLNALNIQSPQSGTSALNYLLTNAASKTTAGSDGILSGQKNLIEGPYEVSVITLLTTSLSAPSPLSGIIFAIYPHPMTVDGYKWNTGILPNINTINANSTFNSSSSNSISVLGQLTDELAQIVYNSTDGNGDNFSSLTSNNASENNNSSSNSNGGKESGNKSISSGNVSNSSNSSSSDNSSSNSSINSDNNESTNSGSNAITDINDAEICSKLKGSDQQTSVYNGPNDNTPTFWVSGTNIWNQMMTCIVQQSQMPSTIEEKLKSSISADISALKKGSKIKYNSWTLGWALNDGSFIYLSFSAPENFNNGGWSIYFSNESPFVSGN